jgi:hypothetical protein
MSNSKTAICVVREVRQGDHQFVPANEVPNFVAGERVIVGAFTGNVENLGPSGSHKRTICLPVGETVEAVIPANALNAQGKLVDGAAVMQCVLRDVRPGDTQFRPVSDVGVLNPGERLFTGVFRTQRENHGPSGSHSLLVALPFGAVTESRLSA